MKMSEKIAALAVGVACMGVGIAWGSYWNTNSNWAGFAGGLIGAGVALWAALVVVEHQRARDREDARSYCRALITRLDEILGQLELDLIGSAENNWTAFEQLEAWRLACRRILAITSELEDVALNQSAGFNPAMFDLRQNLALHGGIFTKVALTEDTNDRTIIGPLAGPLMQAYERLHPQVRATLKLYQ